jgi:hypothetical protein
MIPFLMLFETPAYSRLMQRPRIEASAGLAFGYSPHQTCPLAPRPTSLLLGATNILKIS